MARAKSSRYRFPNFGLHGLARVSVADYSGIELKNVFMQFDPRTQALSVRWRDPGDDRVSFDEYYRHVLQWEMDPFLDCEWFSGCVTSEGLLDELLDRIAAGYSVVTNEHGKSVAIYDEDAELAIEEVEEALLNFHVHSTRAESGPKWINDTLPAGFWTQDDPRFVSWVSDMYGIRPEFTDAQLAELAEELEQDVEVHHDVLLFGAHLAFQDLRDQIRQILERVPAE